MKSGHDLMWLNAKWAWLDDQLLRADSVSLAGKAEDFSRASWNSSGVCLPDLCSEWDPERLLSE